MLDFFCCAQTFPLVAVSRAYSLAVVLRLLIVVASVVTEHRLQVLGLQWLRCTDIVAPKHVESSWTRNQTCVPAFAGGF